MKKRDLYLFDLAEETGNTFEDMAKDKCDMDKVVSKYMKSRFRALCDERSPIQATSMAWEQKIRLKKEFKFDKIRKIGWDPILCAWIGEFYTYIQAYTGLSSKEIIEKIPFEEIYKRSFGLHDLGPKYVVEKIAKAYNIKSRGNVQM